MKNQKKKRFKIEKKNIERISDFIINEYKSYALMHKNCQLLHKIFLIPILNRLLDKKI